MDSREKLYSLQVKMTCIEWIIIPIGDPKREHDVVEQEASSSKSGGSYILGRI